MSEIFILLAQFAKQQGASPINKFPGCWEPELPDGWRVAVNGHDVEMKSSDGKRVPGFHAFFWHAQSMAMALVTPMGGTTVGADTEDAICAALQKAVDKP